MSLGVSIFLLVVGAILTFAVDVTTSGFSINTVGIILMIAGALSLVLSLLFWSSFSPYRLRGLPAQGAGRPQVSALVGPGWTPRPGRLIQPTDRSVALPCSPAVTLTVGIEGIPGGLVIVRVAVAALPD